MVHETTKTARSRTGDYQNPDYIYSVAQSRFHTFDIFQTIPNTASKNWQQDLLLSLTLFLAIIKLLETGIK